MARNGEVSRSQKIADVAGDIAFGVGTAPRFVGRLLRNSVTEQPGDYDPDGERSLTQNVGLLYIPAFLTLAGITAGAILHENHYPTEVVYAPLEGLLSLFVLGRFATVLPETVRNTVTDERDRRDRIRQRRAARRT